MFTLSELCPLTKVKVETERLILRQVRTVQDAVEAADLASQGIYEGTCPFRVDWASASPLVVAQRVFRQQLKNMAADHADPSISLTVYLKSLLLPVIGKANIECIDVDSSSAETGSWLGREFQGRGYGTEARNAVLSLVFALGLDRSNTFVYQSNAASQRVTEKVGGYVLEDIDHSNGRENDPTLRYTMTRRAWEAVPRPEVVISGMQDARAVLGLV